MAVTKPYIPVLLVALIGLLAFVGIMQSTGDNDITGLAMGKFKEEATAHTPMLSVRPECQETDRGYDWYIAGQTWYDTAGYKPKIDWCERDLLLREYFCFNGRIRDRRVTCPVGYSCKEGACLPDDTTYYMTKNSVYRKRAEILEKMRLQTTE